MITHIGADKMRFTTISGDRLFGLTTPTGDNVRARREKVLTDRPTNMTRATRDQHCFSGKILHIVLVYQ
jgi:hypothetical protein